MSFSRWISHAFTGPINIFGLWIQKVEGLPGAAKPNLSLQLSSPVEEAKLSEIYDSSSGEEPAPEGSLIKFDGVETSVATLVISAKDADIPLGSSAPYDLAPLCAIDAMDVKEKYVSELPVAIMADGTVGEVASAEVVEDGKPKDSGKETAVQAVAESTDQKTSVDETPNTEKQSAEAEAQEAAAVPLEPVCTVTLRITYKPSPKDQKEELYELLNKTSQKKAAALENLRKISMSLAKSGGGDSPSTKNAPSSTAVAKPAVRPGFLNKKKKAETSKWEKLYDRTVGPNSLLMKGYGLTLAAKNYIIFFGAVGFFHFKGQLVSLPPPA